MIERTPLWPAQLDHIRLDSERPAALVDFYRATLGMAATALEDGTTLMQAPDRRILIGPGQRGEQPFMAFRVQSRDQLEAFRRHVLARGLEPLASPSAIFRPDAELVAKNLQAAGFASLRAASGPKALEALERGEFALIVLDIGLPGIDGYEITRRVRRSRPTPILMLTARGGEADKILGLELGADDYLTKPFSPQELVARVRAILRRTSPSAAAETPIERGNLAIDPARREIRRDGKLVETTNLEFELLHFLRRHQFRTNADRDLRRCITSTPERPRRDRHLDSDRRHHRPAAFRASNTARSRQRDEMPFEVPMRKYPLDVSGTIRYLLGVSNPPKIACRT